MSDSPVVESLVDDEKGSSLGSTSETRSWQLHYPFHSEAVNWDYPRMKYFDLQLKRTINRLIWSLVYVHRLSAMSEDLKYSYVIIGMKDNGATLGCRTFLPNYTVGMISKDQNLLWYGDIVVGKLKRDATGNETYHDFEASDYPLIRNYFYHT
ncbi:hypothetical protein FKP32DRAFT_1680927 [Trametes sanguinea]|nr:hypothetical protein FKP32DRAFT_1680927 [Trametes sanguinea]